VLILAGVHRFKTALLVELARKGELTLTGKPNMIKRILSSVDEVNKECFASNIKYQVLCILTADHSKSNISRPN